MDIAMADFGYMALRCRFMMETAGVWERASLAGSVIDCIVDT